MRRDGREGLMDRLKAQDGFARQAVGEAHGDEVATVLDLPVRKFPAMEACRVEERHRGGVREEERAGRRPALRLNHVWGNFIHFAPALLLFTAVSMKAMPAMPSSTVGKSYPFFGDLRPAMASAIATAAER